MQASCTKPSAAEQQCALTGPAATCSATLVASPARPVLSAAAGPGHPRPVAGAQPPSERPKPDELLNRMTERQAAMLMMADAPLLAVATEFHVFVPLAFAGGRRCWRRRATTRTPCCSLSCGSWHKVSSPLSGTPCTRLQRWCCCCALAAGSAGACL